VSSPEDLARAIETSGVTDARVLEAFRRVHREGFVPPGWRGRAYADRPIPVPHGQVTTQPSLIARMVAALHLQGPERVLEVGTGLGFQTAILAALAREVVSIERFPDLAEVARRNLEKSGIGGVTVAVGDGTLGLPERAPFDGVVVSAAAPEVPVPLVEQLVEGGRLVHPLGPGGRETVMAYRKEEGRLAEEARLTPASFVPLIGEHGLSHDR
jgi:protein-L-isoaspartate(D-aspartate) O-methyltransferase